MCLHYQPYAHRDFQSAPVNVYECVNVSFFYLKCFSEDARTHSRSFCGSRSSVVLEFGRLFCNS